MAESKSASVVFTNSSLLAKNAQTAAGSAKNAADNAYNLAYSAQKTADGKNSIYRGSNPGTVPTAILKVGDLYFSENAAYIWNGSSWEEAVSDTTGKEIHAKVEEAMAEKDKAIADMRADINADIAKINEEIKQTNIKTGNALNFYKEQYYLSTSYTELVGGSWSDTVPTKTAGKYIWSRYVTANVGDPTNQQYSEPVCISGLDGKDGPPGPQGPKGETGFFIGNTPPSNPNVGTVWATNDASGNMTSAKTWNGSAWVSTAFTQDLVAGNITASKIVGGTLDVNKITVANAQNIPVTSTVSLGDKLSSIEHDADSINAYIKGSRGSKTLEAILSMDPDHSSIAQVVNGQIAAAIGTYSDGTVRIDGKALYINSHAKIDDATIKSAMIDSIDASKITTGELDADRVTIKNLTADKIASGTLNGVTITGSKFIANTDNGNLFGKLWERYQVVVENAGIDMTGSYTIGNEETQVITTLTGGDLYVERITNTVGSDSNNWTKSIDINTDGLNPYIKLVNSGPEPGRYASTYVGSDAVQSNIGFFGKWNFNGYKARADGSLYIANSNGTNFDGHGDVGFQVWSGIGLGKNTIYMPGNDLYVQQGNCGPGLGARYSNSGKVQIHCQKIISQVANTVSSRLSVKTDITPVSYDRALAAVMGTEMYDYRYIADETGQHYVSGIIDDVNPDPQYHMDDMLINKERTARIDANLVGYHHVILQELLKRIDELEIKLKSLESKDK